ncbi:MAG: hypothetical protein ABSG68_26975 [Thermoguttaceae bacterium]
MKAENYMGHVTSRTKGRETKPAKPAAALKQLDELVLTKRNLGTLVIADRRYAGQQKSRSYQVMIL